MLKLQNGSKVRGSYDGFKFTGYVHDLNHITRIDLDQADRGSYDGYRDTLYMYLDTTTGNVNSVKAREIIPSGPVIYLPANLPNEDNTVISESPMFAPDSETEVTVLFSENGEVLIKIGLELNTVQVKALINGLGSNVPYVAKVSLSDCDAPSAYTCFAVTLRPEAARHAFEIREKAAKYAREVISRVETIPTIQQTSLF